MNQGCLASCEVPENAVKSFLLLSRIDMITEVYKYTQTTFDIKITKEWNETFENRKWKEQKKVS